MAFIFPSYRGTDWPLWQVRIGAKLYDLLCGGRNLGKSSGLNQTEVLRLVPDLSDTRLAGAVRYFDGFTNDARLVLDTLRAAQKHGALLLNYCKFIDASREGDVWFCKANDGTPQGLGLRQPSDALAVARSSSESARGLAQSKTLARPAETVLGIRARTVVNATGP